MKIAIPLDENKIDICIIFGRSPFFYIDNDGTAEIVENPASQAEGGAGPKAAQCLIDLDVDVLLTVRCGQNAGDVLKLADIKIFKTEAKTVQENIQLFKENKLSELIHFHTGFHGVQ